MVDQVEYLTREGFERFSAELSYLKEVRRREVAERIREAIAEGGDLMENAGYEIAKHEQSLVEGRIQQLEMLLGNAQPIEEPPDERMAGTVCRNSLVTLQQDGEPPLTYRIVGPAEASPHEGMISYESPLGRALMGRHAGEKIILSAPGGQYTYRILHVADVSEGS